MSSFFGFRNKQILFPCIPSPTNLHKIRSGRSGFRIPEGPEDIFLHNAKAGSGAHPPSYLKGTGVVSSGEGVKLPRRDVDLAPWVKKQWSCSSTPLVCLNGVGGDDF